MSGSGGDEQLEPFGRVKLDGIYSDWASSHHLNPRLLASELAATLETLAPLDQPIQSLHVSVFSGGRSDRNIQITHGALADYFTATSAGRASATISTNSGPIPTANVLIWRKWIERLVDEATTRTEMAAGFAQPANDGVSFSMAVNGSAATSFPPQSVIPSNSSIVLKTQQAQLRREGEKSASEQLDEHRIARQMAEQKAIELSAQLEIKTTQYQHLMDELELQRRELNDERRARRDAEDESIRLEEQLEQVMGLSELMRQDNPLSPPELILALQCWRELTQDGIHNPAAAGGRGVHPLVEAWLERNGYRLNKTETERLCAIVSWRKRGSGAIRSQ
ncbi:hypothetical protein NL64_13335 [Pseudomonas fluorescens]|uniref:hypothetical protein n=1 Tax=Pseudomonas fluorescens TaxID=294 RepID=UPI00054B21FF|nr:hypothetical protein [Pseudomonas fluorescens]KII32220.1 hypothetical protein NL64_13335 [Pseudomonas fluorescens]